ncbi:MAG: four helix bundle protein [Gemmatimonadetes bacterium]|nr:MAG: four helix bundle protein [Gemmatimonadota bacterium]
MTRAQLLARTKAFAIAVLRVVDALPRGRTAEVLGKQLMRAGTSVGANYRTACRARSRREFVAKMGIVEEEADESQFWLELMIEHGMLDASRVGSLRHEAGEIVAIAVSSIRTARRTPRANPQSAIRNPQSAEPPCSSTAR